MKVLPHTIILFLLSLSLISCNGLNDVMKDYNNQKMRQRAQQIFDQQMNERPFGLVDDGIPETPVNF